MSLANRLLATLGSLSLSMLVLSAATCSDESRTTGSPEARTQESSAQAMRRMEDLAARFEPLRSTSHRVVSQTELRAEAGGVIVARSTGETFVDVTLPATADGRTSILDHTSSVGARFALVGARASQPVVNGDLVIYPSVLGARSATGKDTRGAVDLLQRVDGAHVEDFVAFDERPEKEELRYRVDLEGVQSLRLVADHVELLDKQGVPRIRVEPPYVVDAHGNRSAATVDIEGCNVDRDPRAPWGRDVADLQGKTECMLVVGWSGVSYPLLVDPEWTDSGFMIHERTHHTATALPSGDVLLVGGFDALGNGITNAEIMCPAEKCPPLAVFTPTGPLNTARGGQTETLLNSGTDVLFTGGRPTRSSATRLASAEVYSIPNGTFTSTTGAMTNARAEHTATLLDTTGSFKVLVTGGDGSSPTSTAELFDPTTKTFTATSNMTVQRFGHVAELLKDGQVLVAGGISSLGIGVASAELFDPTTNAFTATGNMSGQRAFATATRLEDTLGSILVTGGTNGVGFYSKTADLFIPDGMGGGSFQQQPIIMQAARAHHVATKLLGTGTVLVTGGFDGTTLLDSAEVFDQATAKFVLGASTMKHARAFHTGTRLPSGQAVVTGGGYDPLAGTVNFTTAISTETLERSKGEPCNLGTECASGFCVNTANIGTVCCDSECSGVCQACANDQTGQTTGECHDVLDNTLVKPDCNNSVQLKLLCIGGQVQAGNVLPCAPYSCAGDKCGADTCAVPGDCSVDGWCSANNGCQFKQELATTCNEDAQCKSAHCIDGFCCDTACGGECEACDDSVHPGFCTQAIGKPHGARPACKGTGSACEGTCGSTRDACDYGGNECGDSTCQDGVQTSGTCSTTDPGTCVMGPTQCGAFACDSVGKRCIEMCTAVTDCAAGAVCQNGQCTLVESDACDGDHTVVSPDGTSQDCSPLKCSGAACINRCNSVDDCVSPNVCNDKGQCIPPPANPKAPSGCTIGAMSSRDQDTDEGKMLLIMGLGTALVFARRRMGGGNS